MSETQTDTERLSERIREITRFVLPWRSGLWIVSGGDDALLELDRPRVWHFPTYQDGSPAGRPPSDSSEAIARLESARARGCAGRGGAA